MAVDLGDLIESLRNELSPPGSNLFPDATDDDWILSLQNAFWEARLQGAFPAYTESEGVVTPLSGTDDLPREHQQLIILFAGLNVALSDYRNLQSSFRAQAGPVEVETQRSATILKAVLDALKAKLSAALTAAIQGPGGTGNTAVFDAVINRTESLAYGTSWFVR